MSEVRINTSTELFILQAALIEAKLPRLANDGDLAASPIVAALAERVTAACRDEPELASISDRWRNLTPTHLYWKVAISRALADQGYLRKADRSKREEYVRWLLAPFRNDEATIDAFLAELADIFATRRWYQLFLRSERPFHGGVAFLRERNDGNYVALDADHNEITSSKSEGDVGAILLERGLEPFGYFVEAATPAK
jgi:hypothetical protein